MDENQEQEVNSSPSEVVAEAAKIYLLKHYCPCDIGTPGAMLLSSKEICEKLSKVYSSNLLSPALISQWMVENNFQCIDTTGDINLKWILKKIF